jgi:hypothetical protein
MRGAAVISPSRSARFIAAYSEDTADIAVRQTLLPQMRDKGALPIGRHFGDERTWEKVAPLAERVACLVSAGERHGVLPVVTDQHRFDRHRVRPRALHPAIGDDPFGEP